MACGIYSITNTTTNKRYIGSSKKIHIRWSRHRYDLGRGKHHCIHLQRSWDKHGEDAFEFEILLICDEDELLDQEQVILDEVSSKTHYNVSNTASGGDLISNHPNRDEIRKRQSDSGRLRYAGMTDAQKKEMYGLLGELNHNWKGGVSSPKCPHCNRSMSFRAITCAQCRDRSEDKNPFYGKRHSDETIAKIRSSKLGKKPSNERPVLIESVRYRSVTDAARQLSVSPATICYRIKSKNFDYAYADAAPVAV